MPFLAERIDHLDLAILDIDEAVDRVAGPDDIGAGGIDGLAALRPQRRDMLGRQRHTLHLPQIAPDRLHPRPPATPCRAMMAMVQPVRNGRGCSGCDQAHQ